MWFIVECEDDVTEPKLARELWASPLDDDHNLCLAPGALYRWERIVQAGVSLQQLQRVHLEVLVCFVRDDDGRPFHPRMLADINPSFQVSDIIFMMPWAAQLTPELTTLWGLKAREMVAGGLTRRLLKKRWWKYARWQALFDLTPENVTQLGVTEPEAYFPDYDARATKRMTRLAL